MRTFLQCFELVNGAIYPVPDPVIGESSDIDGAIRAAGYKKQLSSVTDAHVGAEINVYSTERADMPMYYIELYGAEHSLAYLIAADFPQLLVTLKELHPLIAMMGLEQQATIQADVIVERERMRREQRAR